MSDDPLEEILREVEGKTSAELEVAEQKIEAKLDEVRVLEKFVEEARAMLGGSPRLFAAVTKVLSDNGHGLSIKDLTHTINAKRILDAEVGSNRVKACVALHSDAFAHAGGVVKLVASES